MKENKSKRSRFRAFVQSTNFLFIRINCNFACDLDLYEYKYRKRYKFDYFGYTCSG